MLNKMRGILDVCEQATQVAIEETTRPLSNGTSLNMLSHERLPFSLEEFVRRYELISKGIEEAGLDAILIRTPENITYFSGYETPGYYKYHCIIIAPGQDPVFLLRDFEWMNIPEFSWITKFVKVYDNDFPPALTAGILNKMGLAGKRIGTEQKGWFYTVEEHLAIAKETGCELICCTDLLRKPRQIKSQEEIDVIDRACQMVDKATLAGYEATVEGASGDQINAVVNHSLFEDGCGYMGLPPFVLVGDRSCVPHATGGANVLKKNDVMYFEISASYKRYTGALMRTIFLGNPKREWVDCAKACIAAVEAACDFIKPGVTSGEADTVARAAMKEHGFDKNYLNRLGYSLGIAYAPDWGEGEVIDLKQGDERVLQPGMVFHMPPMNLKWREYGIGFSETIVLTEDGCRSFSKLPKEIIIK